MNDSPLSIEHPRTFSARSNALSGTYFNIAESEYCECLRISNIDTDDLNNEDKSNLEIKSKQAKIKAIVFKSNKIDICLVVCESLNLTK